MYIVIAHFSKNVKGQQGSVQKFIFSPVCAIISALDRRQAVRHWVLVPAFAGSNPAGPAIFFTKKSKSEDIGLTTFGTNPAGPAIFFTKRFNKQGCERVFIALDTY